jgi:GTP-binding protein YchF
VVHVLRCFEDDDVTHVEGKIDPVADAETVETELMLADLESLEKRLPALEKKAKGADKEAKEAIVLVNKALALLRDGKPARLAELAAEERAPYSQLGLMTAKPVLYVLNVEEASAATGNAISARAEEMARRQGARSVVISAKIEEEIAQMPMEDRKDFLDSLGLEEPGLNRLIRTGYDLLGLLTFFTVGPKEARAWTVTKGSRGPQAAGVIHTDFEQGYIRAETIAYADYVAGKGEAGARDAGKFRLEGKDYIVQDGDVMHFRFNN